MKQNRVSKFYRFLAKDNAGTPMTIIVKCMVKRGGSLTDDDVLQQAEDLGVDFEDIKYFSDVVEIPKSQFNILNVGGDKNLYIEWEEQV